MEFTISNNAKKTVFGLIGVGLIALIIGLLTDHSHELSQRVWSNLLINGFFFFAIALGALYFLALQYATETGWFVVIKRVVEGVMSYLPIGIGVLIVVFLASSLHLNHLYHWMDPDVVNPESEHYDELIAGKTPYLNQIFFWIRALVYFAVFMIFLMGFKKRSKQQDEASTKEEVESIHFTNYRKGATFLVFFAVFSSTLTWDWLMSIDTHWFSTLYGWYVFAGMWCTAMVTIMMVTLYLKSKGLLEKVNDSHIHDIGKWVFATSFLWSYLWFSQFMLYWYSNIPEEVAYYVQRIEEYNGIFFGMFMINFIIPMVVLMSRDAKRNASILIFVCLVIFVGHWIDVFMLITPGTMFDHGGISLLEVGMFLMFLGAFIYIILNALTKAPLIPKNHPYLDESLHHEI